MNAIRFSDERLGFSAAHVTQINGIWKLHGHNFRINVTLKRNDEECPLHLTFEKIKTSLKKFDHKIILPSNKMLHKEKNNMVFEFGNFIYSFPISDCMLIPSNDANLQEIIHAVYDSLKIFSILNLEMSPDGISWISK